ncbi:MAG: hypothetical protein A3F11_06495 [Gammaproteobacteria bacterium RIFCSPHIGHO2_12_FULL_37_14]|nr:MAG: hypothetical protein A3F11_06495 [Gammaproteobacteria bacterium RIFCSPHIGHO2_12_FULL_37_14]
MRSTRLNYCVDQDKDGNSPLLQAAQPAYRKHALEDLKKAIAAGTHKYKTVSSQKSWQGKLREGDIFFEEKEVKGDGDCGFHALGTTREIVSHALILLISDDQARSYLAEEIIAAFFANELTIPPEQSELSDLLRQYSNGQHNLDDLLKQTKTVCASILTPEENRADASTLANILYSKTPSTLLDEALTNPNKVLTPQESDIVTGYLAGIELENKNKEVADLLEDTRKYCARPELFKYYLTQLQDTTLWLGYRTAILFAKQQNISLYIWRPLTNANQTISLAEGYNGTDPKNIIHLLHTNKFTHFNLLNQIPRLQQQMQKQEIYLDKSPFDENKFKHNLLHRAVRSLAADQLAIYLLTECGFASKINDRDIFGKTALHRAIKYFAEQRDKIIEQLTREGEANATALYFSIIDNCLRTLVTAGADLDTIKDHEGLTVLDRANKYNSLFQWPDLTFKLSEKLKAMRHPVHPTMASIAPVAIQQQLTFPPPQRRSTKKPVKESAPATKRRKVKKH